MIGMKELDSFDERTVAEVFEVEKDEDGDDSVVRKGRT